MAERRVGRARRRRAVAVGTAGAVVVAGAGTAWAMTNDGGPAYRFATVGRSTIAQTVDADGMLTARDRSTLSFAADGTVKSVDVAVGDTVHAGDTLATLDRSELEAAVITARAALAQAKQRLADDEQAQLTGTSPSSSDASAASPTASASNGKTGDDAGHVQLTSAVKPTGAATSVRAAQQAVEDAQRTLDAAVDTVTADIDAADAACTSDAVAATTDTVTADDDGTVSGTVDGTPVLATLLDTSSPSVNPQSVAAGGSYRFTGLTPGHDYEVVLVPRIDTTSCTTALATMRNDQAGATNAASVVNAKAALQRAITALNAAVATLGSSSPTGSAPSGAAPSGSARPSNGSSVPSGSTSPSNADTPSSGSTVSGEQIAADAKAIDAARAELAVAKHDLSYATLTTPITGTVGSIDLSKGDVVAASSSTATITIVGSGTLAVDLNIGIADIDHVKAGEHAEVTVDGRAKPVDATVTYVGAANSSDSTGSSSTYPVTVSLTARDARLFDGMGASVAIEVGRASGVLSVPVSAVHTAGSVHTVKVYADGKLTTTPVTLGVEGDERVQITSGLSVGQQVVLADISASVPSGNSSDFGDRLGGLNKVSGGGPVFLGPPKR